MSQQLSVVSWWKRPIEILVYVYGVLVLSAVALVELLAYLHSAEVFAGAYLFLALGYILAMLVIRSKQWGWGWLPLSVITLAFTLAIFGPQGLLKEEIAIVMVPSSLITYFFLRDSLLLRITNNRQRQILSAILALIVAVLLGHLTAVIIRGQRNQMANLDDARSYVWQQISTTEIS